jgi:hypothetical protein
MRIIQGLNRLQNLTILLGYFRNIVYLYCFEIDSFHYITYYLLIN